MQKTKAKRDSHSLTRLLPFAIVWAISAAVVSMLFRAFTSDILFRFLPPQNAADLDLLMGAVIMGLVPVVMVEHWLRRSMCGWLLYTAASSVVILLLIRVGLPAVKYVSGRDMLYLMAYIAPTPLIQGLWLRRHVRKAWLWPLLTIMIVWIFSTVHISGSYEFINLIMLLSFGLIQASLMHYLWKHPRDSKVARIDIAADEQADAERLQRLQEAPYSSALWDRGPDRALQSETR